MTPERPGNIGNEAAPERRRESREEVARSAGQKRGKTAERVATSITFSVEDSEAHGEYAERKEALLAKKTPEWKAYFKPKLEALKQYLNIKEEDGGLEVTLNIEAFEKLSLEEQLSIQSELLKIQAELMLKQEEVLLELEDREFMQDFYRANQALAAGNYTEAKKLYLSFSAKYQVAPGMSDEDVRMTPEVVRATDALKQIAEYEIGLAEARLDELEKSVNRLPGGGGRLFVDKLGTSRLSAQSYLNQQRIVLGVMRQMIASDKEIFSIEEAAKILERGFSVPYQEREAYFREKAGVTKFEYDGKQILLTSGDNSVEHYFTKSNVAELDGIRAIIEERGDTKPERLLELAEKYKERGLYDVSEKLYDLYFRDTYREYAKGALDHDTFVANLRKDPEKMGAITKMIDEYAKQRTAKDNPLSPEERALMEAHLIGDAWKQELRAKITTEFKKGPEGNLEAAKWNTFNKDLLQIDRSWYEFWEMTLDEYDRFIETLPFEIAMLAASAGIASAVGKGVTSITTKAILKRELAKLGMKEAFEEGGKRAAISFLKSKLGGKAAGFLAESVAFAEINTLARAVQTGNMAALIDFNEHLKAWGHSIVTLGVLKTVNLGVGAIKPLAQMEGVTGAVARTAVAVPVDTIALTGINVGLLEPGMTDDQIAATIRSNIVLSFGMRVGHGALKMAKGERGKAKERLPEEKTGKGKELNIESLASEAQGIMAEVMKLHEGGRLTEARRMQFVQRLSLIGVSMMAVLPRTARAAGFWETVGNLPGNVASTVGGIVNIAAAGALIYGGYRSYSALKTIFTALKIPISGRLIARKFEKTAGSLIDRGRLGAPGDIAARDAGEALRTALNAQAQARTILESIRRGRYESGPLKELSTELGETGARILEILGRSYGGPTDPPFDPVEFNGLIASFRAGVANLPTVLRQRSSVRITAGDAATLTAFVALIYLVYQLRYGLWDNDSGSDLPDWRDSVPSEPPSFEEPPEPPVEEKETAPPAPVPKPPEPVQDINRPVAPPTQKRSFEDPDI